MKKSLKELIEHFSGKCIGNKTAFTLAEGATHVARQHKKRRASFTLAEVLITLGIIGVVAALTIPTLVQNYKRHVVETKLAKFYSVMNNAIKMAEAEYGPTSTWTDFYVSGSSFDKGNTYDIIINKYIAPYVKIIGSKEFEILSTPQKIYYLSDGTAFGFGLHNNISWHFYTTNPEKCNTTNSLGTCHFMFVFTIKLDDRIGKEFQYNIGKGLQPTLYMWDGNEESLMNDTSCGCKNGNGAYCTEIIRRNGWKIPKDYPRKF